MPSHTSLMSLDRLIDLAKRTGDRLIIHDPINGRDIVILGIDAYEALTLPDKGKEPLFDLDFEDKDHSHSDQDLNHNDDDWQHVGSLLEDRYGPEFGSLQTPSLVDGLWTKDGQSVGGKGQNDESTHDSGKDTYKEEGEPLPGDEPIFYEEPVV